MLFNYYGLILTVTSPWIASVFALSWYLGAKQAAQLFGVEKTEARSLALKSTLAALICCLPFALLVPVWSGLHIVAYFALAIGMQYSVVRQLMPDLAKETVWQWSYRVNGIAAALSIVVWIATLAFYFTFGKQFVQPYTSSVYREQQERIQKAEAALRSTWYKVPTWAAGKWHSTLRLEGTEIGAKEANGAGAVQDYYVGQFADKEGQIWQRDQTDDWQNYDFYPFYSDPRLIACFVGMRRPDTSPLRSRDWTRCFPSDRKGPSQRSLTIMQTAKDRYETTVKISKIKNGQCENTKQYIFRAEKVAPFVPRADFRDPEGHLLFSQFCDYLGRNGLSSLIPEQPPH